MKRGQNGRERRAKHDRKTSNFTEKLKQFDDTKERQNMIDINEQYYGKTETI